MLREKHLGLKMTDSEDDPHKAFIDALGPGLQEWVEPLPPLPSRPAADFENMLGASIGAGSSREVFAIKDNPKAIIKRCKLPFIGANMFEFFIWNNVRGGQWEDVFGEVLVISEDGRYLAMERLDDIGIDDHARTPSMPDWAKDLQPKNFGKSRDGKIKVRDYAMCSISGALNAARPYRYAWQLPGKK
ncbi:hypothetical protein [Bradyrhizobium sp. 131]|uniref:hypothetical protein n=1 Tax=Bradyrhizobium sp. 131 TaxID=2782609 RepID=UPI0020000F69|nr:hypothetical protein [Bradyrhizobium sp. 131]UPK17608.1 hypothetical protein IVA73_26470 [Bradyrhizobium sp. 131]